MLFGQTKNNHYLQSKISQNKSSKFREMEKRATFPTLAQLVKVVRAQTMPFTTMKQLVEKMKPHPNVKRSCTIPYESQPPLLVLLKRAQGRYLGASM